MGKSKVKLCIAHSPSDLAAATKLILRMSQLTPEAQLGVQRFHDISRRCGGGGLPDLVTRYAYRRQLLEADLAKLDPPRVPSAAELEAVADSASDEIIRVFQSLGSLDGLMTPRCEELIVRTMLRTGSPDPFTYTTHVLHSMQEAVQRGIAGPGYAFLTELPERTFRRRADIVIYRLNPGESPSSITRIDPTRVVGMIEAKAYGPDTPFGTLDNLRQVVKDLMIRVKNNQGDFSGLYYAFPQSYDRFEELPALFLEAFDLFKQQLREDTDLLKQIFGLSSKGKLSSKQVESLIAQLETNFRSALAGDMIIAVPAP